MCCEFIQGEKWFPFCLLSNFSGQSIVFHRNTDCLTRISLTNMACTKYKSIYTDRLKFKDYVEVFKIAKSASKSNFTFSENQ